MMMMMEWPFLVKASDVTALHSGESGIDVRRTHHLRRDAQRESSRPSARPGGFFASGETETRGMYLSLGLLAHLLREWDRGGCQGGGIPPNVRRGQVPLGICLYLELPQSVVFVCRETHL